MRHIPYPGSGFEWLLAWRMVRSRKSRFLSVITVVAIVGIACGVMALTIVLSVTGGFQDAFRERILGLHPHLLVWPRDEQFTSYRETMALLLQDPRIVAATPATYDEMMIARGDRRAGAVIKGVDLPSVGGVLDLRSLMLEGSVDALDETPRASRRAGRLLLDNLVQETSLTVILWDGEPAIVHQDDQTAPLPEEAYVAVVHAAPDLATIDVALAGADAARASDLAPGSASRPLLLPAGDAVFEVRRPSGDKSPLFGEPVVLESARSYVLVVCPGPKGIMLDVPPDRPAPGEARVRVVRVGSGAGMEAVQAGDTVIPPGESALVAAREPAILLGSALAERLDAEVGHLVALASPFRGLGDRGPAPVGMEPTSGRFRVAGIFRSGYYDYDKRFGLVAFGAALRFLNTGDRAKWLEVRVDDVMAIDDRKNVVAEILQPYSLATFAEDLALAQERVDRILGGDVSQLEVEEPDSALGLLRNATQVVTGLRLSLPHTFRRDSSYSVITWKEVNEPLFQALKLQKLVLSVFFLIIIVVAAFNIVGTQIMMVGQKQKEISILKALGSSSWVVRKVFLIQGLIVAALGTLIGLLAGLSCCYLLDRVGYPLEPEVYLISELPVAIDLVEVGVVVLAALVLTFLATLYSAGRAGRLTPVEGIRYVE